MNKTDTITKCLSCDSTHLKAFTTTKAQMHHNEETFTFVKCNNCGLIMLNPRVAQESLHEYYSDYYLPFRGPSAWGRYAPLVAKNLGKTDKKRVKIAKSAVSIDQNSTVLDVGCGKPTFLKKLQEATGARCKGIDFTDEGWKTETDTYRNIDLEVAEFHQFSASKPFDLITMWHYLEHDYQPKATLKRMKQVAHPETRMLIEVPNFDSWTRKLQKQHWEGYHTPRHTAVYTPETITKLLEESGWQVEKIKPYGTLDPYPLFWMGRQEKRGIDWSQSMEKKFVGFVAGMLLTAPIFMLKKWLPAGIMTIVARPAL
ncbi:class I SAM-dependent methyltransferase [Salinivirga cyanobacteriivorans]